MKYLIPLFLLIFLSGFASAAVIDGKVTDSLTTDPIAGAKLTVFGVSTDPADSVTYTTSSARDGSFSFANLPAGMYSLLCQHPDYKRVYVPEFKLEENDAKTFHLMMLPAVGPQTNSVGGQVFSTPPMLPAFIPIEGATVLIKGDNFSQRTLTDKDGIYKFTDLSAGQYLMWASAPGHLTSPVPDTVYVGDFSHITRHNFYLIPEEPQEPVHLAGYVYNDMVNMPNYPVYPATISLTYSMSMMMGPIDIVVAEVTNNPDGSFLIKDLAPGIYDVRCKADGFATEYIRALNLTTGPDTVTFYMHEPLNPPDNMLCGLVLNSSDDAPIVKATVSLTSLGPTDIAYIAYSDAKGIYCFKSIIPGKYELRGVARGFEPSAMDTVEITENSILKDHNIYLDPISGLVTLHGIVQTETETGMEPVYPAGISLFGYSADGDSIVYHTRNDSDGTYIIKNILPGRYTVCCGARGFFPQTIRDMALTEPEVLLDFTLQPKVLPENGCISGSVVFDGTNLPVHGAVINFMNDNNLQYRTMTSRDGSYKMCLPEGKYYVSCSFQRADSALFYREYYDDVQSLADATPVGVLAGEETSGIDFGIPAPVPVPSVVISGVVTDDQGNPLGSALVRAIQINPPTFFRDNQDVYQVWTNDDGSYKMEIFFNYYFAPNMMYGFMVSAEKPGYKIEFYNEKPAPYLADILWTSNGNIFADINFTLDPAGAENSISGTLTANTGVPIGQGFVIGVNADSKQVVFTFTDYAGNYTLNSLDNGYYYLLFVAAGFIPEFYDDVFLWEDATPVLASGNVTGIDAELYHFMNRMTNCFLAGRVTDQSGEPLSGAMILVRDQNQAMISYGMTDQRGYYSLNGLEDGIFQVQISQVNYQSTSEWIEFDSQESESMIYNFNLETVVTTIPDNNTETVTLPTSVELLANYPNPFNPETRIGFALPEAQYVKLIIYDLLGRKINEIVNGVIPAGNHIAVWDGTSTEGRRVSTGIYFYALITEGKQMVRKMILSK